MTIYDATLGRQLPELPQLWVGYHVLPPSRSSEQIDASLAKASEKKVKCVLDWEANDAIERMDPNRTSGNALDQAIQQAHSILDHCEEFNASVDVGFWSIGVPTAQHYNTIRSDSTFGVWRTETGKLSHGPRSIIDRLPRLYPQLYLPPAWKLRWPEFRSQSQTVLNRVAMCCRDWQKECVPFIRPDQFADPLHWHEWKSMVLDECGSCAIWEVANFNPAYWS